MNPTTLKAGYPRPRLIADEDRFTELLGAMNKHFGSSGFESKGECKLMQGWLMEMDELLWRYADE